MATILRIKRSGSTGSATNLKLGELAYSYLTGTQSNGGDRLYIGEGGVDSNGDAVTISVIGGQYFTNMLDHVAGTLTASSAIITDASSKIDVLNVDNLTLNGNAITSTNTNGNITLTPNGSGEVVASTLTVSDLTNNRVLIAGTSGAIEDDGNLTYDGTALSANSLKVTDLTNNRVVIAGTGGAIEDDGNFTFDGTTLTLGAAANITGAVNITGDLDVDNVNINGNSIITTNTNGDLNLSPNGTGTVVINTDLDVDNININGNVIATSNSNGDLTLTPNGTGTVVVSTDLDVDNVNVDGNTISITNSNGSLTLTPNGTGTAIVSGTTAIQVPAGTTAQRPSAVTGQIRFNSTLSAFEGYHGSSWNSLGGIIDVDQDTKITAENSAGADSDALKFFTGGTLRMTLDSDKLSFDGINKLITSSGSSFTIDPNPSGDSGELIILGNLTVEGTTTTINSTVVSINDRAMVLADSATDSAGANNAGIIINGPAIKPSILYKSATDTFSLSKAFTQPASGSVENLLANYTTDNVAEGSSNLYFTNERVDDRLNNLLLAGEAIDLTYNDAANTLQIDVELATKSNPGAASFDSDQMTVTSGAVTITELDGGTY